MKYGCIGEVLRHSFSKEIHARLADYDYELCEIRRDKFSEFMTKKDFLGINVTIPYKEAVIPYLDEIDDSAKSIGAVNTVVNKNGRLYGYNTDFLGMKMLLKHSAISLKNKKVLRLGTGGTSKTAFAVASDSGAREIIKVSRKSELGCTYEDAYLLHKDTEIIINTTPVGMFPNTSDTPIDISKFPRRFALSIR